jgi:predicted transcriptional regulator of viral defense system
LNAIVQMRQNIAGEVFDYQALLDALAGYRKPRDKITRLLASGAVVRVKKGLYCFGEAFRKEPLSREHLANLIYGPSYVSLDYALSHHALIPERVETVTSVTTRRSRDFDTPFGAFSYRMLNGPRYAVGAILETAGKTPFLVASPEKALADKVWTDKRFSGLRVSDYDAYLTDDLRIDREALRRFDYPRLQVIATAYDSAKINNLVRYLKRLEAAPHA